MFNEKQIIKKLDNEFKPRIFEPNPIDEVLKSSESKVIIVMRQEKNASAYSAFDNDFSLYLDKIPTSPVKKYISSLFNKKLIFFGTAKNNDITSISRILITKDDKLAGIVLNSYALDISISKGETPQIDECVYASYSALVRAAVIINKTEIRKDKDFHKAVSTFLFLLFLKMLGRYMTVGPQQKALLHLVCVYLFYRHYLSEKHNSVISIIEKEYVGDIVSKEVYQQVKDQIEKLVSFDSMKDISRIIYDLHIAQLNPQQIIMTLIKTVGQTGFYALIGPLDGLIAAAVLCKYPTELISKNILTSNDVHEEIENQVSKYIEKIKYDSTVSNFTA